MKGLVHSIEPFGTFDGPGIRMVVFLTGCPMGCKFCHNPEIAWSKQGDLYTPQDLIATYAKNHSFYQNGGLTFSGGEPLAQGEFVLACAKEMKQNQIHLTLDTSLACGEPWIDSLSSYIDLWMVSIKAVSADLHHDIAKRDNQPILDRITRLNLSGATMLLRYVIIPGMTDTPKELGELAKFVLSLPNPLKLELLAYHSMGIPKWQEMGLHYELTNVPDASKQDVKKSKEQLVAFGITDFVN